LSGRPADKLTRRDVARALLTVPAVDALASLPEIRRGLLAAGNPLSAAFWSSAETTLHKISDGDATIGDVQGWLEATGTEPIAMIGLHIWSDQPERSELQEEMHARLVTYLEEQLAAGDVDPDRLADGDTGALRAYADLQERWMTSPLPDGRIPMHELLDEQDEEFLAEWDAADADALHALQTVLDQVGERRLPEAELRTACRALRAELNRGPGALLAAFCGSAAKNPPVDDAEFWLSVAVGVASPDGGLPDDPAETGDFDAADIFGADDGQDPDDEETWDEEPDGVISALAAVSALDHYDWIAAISALVRGGPGTPASAADLARYVSEYDPEDPVAPDADTEDDVDDDGFGDFEDADFDQEGIAGLFEYVTLLWREIGAIDEDDRLTALGWWGLPEAMRRVWTPST
jgi:hypothetical protein